MRGMGKKRDALRLWLFVIDIESKELAKVSSSYGETGRKEQRAWSREQRSTNHDSLEGLDFGWMI